MGAPVTVGAVANEAVVRAYLLSQEKEMRMSWGLTLRERSLTVQTDAQILHPKTDGEVLPAVAGKLEDCFMIFLIHRSLICFSRYHNIFLFYVFSLVLRVARHASRLHQSSASFSSSSRKVI